MPVVWIERDSIAYIKALQSVWTNVYAICLQIYPLVSRYPFIIDLEEEILMVFAIPYSIFSSQCCFFVNNASSHFQWLES